MGIMRALVFTCAVAAILHCGSPIASAQPATAENLETFLALPPFGLDGFEAGTAFEGSAVRQSFTAQVGDILSFDYNFFTNEEVGDLGVVEDFAVVSVGGLFATQLANVSSTEAGGGFYGRQTGYQTFTAQILQGGTFTLGIGIVNVSDAMNQSMLLIDNILLTGSPVFPNTGFTNESFDTGNFSGFQTIGDASVIGSFSGIDPTDGAFQASLTTGGPVAVPEPATVTLFGVGMLGLFLINRRRAGQATQSVA